MITTTWMARAVYIGETDDPFRVETAGWTPADLEEAIEGVYRRNRKPERFQWAKRIRFEVLIDGDWKPVFGPEAHARLRMLRRQQMDVHNRNRR